MNNVAFAYLTKDRVALTEQTWPRVVEEPGFDAYWFDGSATDAGKALGQHYRNYIPDVTGGADRAIVFALTTLLAKGYDYVGLIENDVMLEPDWFVPMFQLFKRGEDDGLLVGAVSARSYEDRILIQCSGYAVMHNLGAGMVLFSADAARLILTHYRSTYTLENRSIFGKLAGIDIGRYWAFRGSGHWLTADWGFDVILARHGLASLALTPPAARMLENIAAQGLKYADQPFEMLRDEYALAQFATRTANIRAKTWDPGQPDIAFVDGCHWIFAHQLGYLDCDRPVGWEVRWNQAFGPFVYEAMAPSVDLTFRVFGPLRIVASHGSFTVNDQLVRADAQTMMFVVQSPGADYRIVHIVAAEPGVRIYAVVTGEQQPTRSDYRFDFHQLPGVV